MIDEPKYSAVMPSATPSETEIAEWQALPRDEQLRRMRLELSHPDTDIISTSTMDEIRAEGRLRAAKVRHG
jgi:hypothetical protein